MLANAFHHSEHHTRQQPPHPGRGASLSQELKKHSLNLLQEILQYFCNLLMSKALMLLSTDNLQFAR